MSVIFRRIERKCASLPRWAVQYSCLTCPTYILKCSHSTKRSTENTRDPHNYPQCSTVPPLAVKALLKQTEDHFMPYNMHFLPKITCNHVALCCFLMYKTWPLIWLIRICSIRKIFPSNILQLGVPAFILAHLLLALSHCQTSFIHNHDVIVLYQPTQVHRAKLYLEAAL